MTPLRTLLSVAALSAAVSAGTVLALQPSADPPAASAPAVHPPEPVAPHFDAQAIDTGRLAMERLPQEVGAALEAHSEEIVKTAQALEGKQARITGTCAPGSAIRVIAGDGSVSCQRLPRGVITVPALAGVPRLSTTTTTPAAVRGGIGRFQSAGEDDFLVVPVALPDGAMVTSFTFVYFDSAPAVDGAAYLYRSDDEPMAMVPTTGASDHVRVGTTEEIQFHKVDATRYAYFVYFQVSTAAGQTLLPISASVAYRLP